MIVLQNYTCSDNEWSRLQGHIEFEPNTGCWLWSRHTVGGYAYTRLNNPRRSVYAHRVFYTRLVGPVSDVLELDHLCRVRSCCNPAHLEPVTCKENLRRGPMFGSHKTHCPRGHEYTAENTYVQTSSGGIKMRSCKECSKQKTANAYRADPVTAAKKRKEAYWRNPESREKKRLYMLEYNRRKRAEECPPI